MFIGRFVASTLALLIASSLFVTHAQDQPAGLSNEDEAEILGVLIQREIKPFGSWFEGIRTFSSENIGSVSATRIAKHGFSLRAARDIQERKRDHVVEYLIIRSIYLRDGIVVVSLSAVSEGRPCFAPAFSSARHFAYEFQRISNNWVGRLVKGPVPFPFTRSLATTP